MDPILETRFFSDACQALATEEKELQRLFEQNRSLYAHQKIHGIGCLYETTLVYLVWKQLMRDQFPQKALLVSPVVDMESLITKMMQWANVTEEQLQRAGKIHTSFGETLSWEYLCWVREHPLQWHGPTQVLYGDKDDLTTRTGLERFRQGSGAHLTIVEGGEHWFHTEVQLAVLQSWEEENL